MLDFLPKYIDDALQYLNFQYLYEIRLRADKPITVNYKGNFYFLSEYGLTDHHEKGIPCTKIDIANCVYKAGKYSIYSVEEQLKKGFLTTDTGIRLGITGDYVFDKGQPLALRNFSSICVRIPHEIINSGEDIYNSCMRDKVRSVLIMSAPGLGKTTILRDLSRILSEKTSKNILICDERGEISMGNTGYTCDVMRFCDKATAFEAGIRALRPDVIITDELSAQDCAAVHRAIISGIQVVASAHISDVTHIQTPFGGLFDRYVLLNESVIGRIRCIYDKKGKECI